MAGLTQIPLDFGHVPAFSEADFLVAESNAEAHGWVMRWPNWPGFALALCGPEGCGKSHLAHVFRDRSGGVLIAAGALAVEDVPTLADRPSVVVEDAERGVDETALFHLYNLVRERRGFLLLTGRSAPARWALSLPDLRSRLATVPVAAVRPPDDGLLEALLLKLFADRQLRIGPDVLSFLLPRMERTFAGARALVEAIDVAALSRQRPVTVPLVREVLKDGAAPIDEDF